MPPEPPVSRDLSLLAPAFRAAVTAAITDCAAKGMPVMVAEALRSQARQKWLYDSSRPPNHGPWRTNAPSALTSWHGYGLAIDFCHLHLGWAPHGKDEAANAAWFKTAAGIFEAHGCYWGGRFTHPDDDHVQWAKCPPSPASADQAMFGQHGGPAVWKAHGAA